MRRLGLISLLIIIGCLAPAQAQDDALTPCTRDEFLNIFDLVIEDQLGLANSVSSVADLLQVAQAHIERRENELAQLPRCADAVAYRRLIIELAGDYIGRTALDISGIAAADNPYRINLAGDQERLEALVSGMLSIDRSDALDPAERSLPQCGAEASAALDEVVADFMTLINAEPDYPVPTINALLLWRETQFPEMPACADGIELGRLLSAAVTDAATSLAVAIIASSESNPFFNLTASSLDRLNNRQELQEDLRAMRAEAAGRADGLPLCSGSELSIVYAALTPGYAELQQRAQAINSAADLEDYSEFYLAFRAANLTHLPTCAEAFELGWEVRHVLGDLASSRASALVAPPGYQDLFQARLEAGGARAARLLDHLRSRVDGAAGAASAQEAAPLPACGRANILRLQVYLLPPFYAVSEAAMSLQTWEDFVALMHRSLEFRDTLRRELPRCAEAIEVGLVMRRIAADFVAMLWLELAGVPLIEIPQVRAVAEDMIWLSRRTEALFAAPDKVDIVGKTYFVIAERGANIRACSSTDCAVVATALGGEALDVIDDSGAWHKVNLPENQIGYIASFLVSETPPTS